VGGPKKGQNGFAYKRGEPTRYIKGGRDIETNDTLGRGPSREKKKVKKKVKYSPSGEKLQFQPPQTHQTPNLKEKKKKTVRFKRKSVVPQRKNRSKILGMRYRQVSREKKRWSGMDRGIKGAHQVWRKN